MFGPFNSTNASQSTSSTPSSSSSATGTTTATSAITTTNSTTKTKTKKPVSTNPSERSPSPPARVCIERSFFSSSVQHWFWSICRNQKNGAQHMFEYLGWFFVSSNVRKINHLLLIVKKMKMKNKRRNNKNHRIHYSTINYLIRHHRLKHCRCLYYRRHHQPAICLFHCQLPIKREFCQWRRLVSRVWGFLSDSEKRFNFFERQLKSGKRFLIRFLTPDNRSTFK